MTTCIYSERLATRIHSKGLAAGIDTQRMTTCIYSERLATRVHSKSLAAGIHA